MRPLILRDLAAYSTRVPCGDIAAVRAVGGSSRVSALHLEQLVIRVALAHADVDGRLSATCQITGGGQTFGWFSTMWMPALSRVLKVPG